MSMYSKVHIIELLHLLYCIAIYVELSANQIFGVAITLKMQLASILIGSLSTEWKSMPIQPKWCTFNLAT